MKTIITTERKGVSEKIMFTLISQPFNSPVPAILQSHNLTGKCSHQSSSAPCIECGRMEFKTQLWLLYPDFMRVLSKPRMHWDRVVPLTACCCFLPKSQSQKFKILVSISQLDTHSPQSRQALIEHTALRFFFLPQKPQTHFLLSYTAIYNVGNLIFKRNFTYHKILLQDDKQNLL